MERTLTLIGLLRVGHDHPAQLPPVFSTPCHLCGHLLQVSPDLACEVIKDNALPLCDGSPEARCCAFVQQSVRPRTREMVHGLSEHQRTLLDSLGMLGEVDAKLEQLNRNEKVRMAARAGQN